MPLAGAPSPAVARILAKTPPRLGPFRIVRQLGEGGFAPVFSAVEEHGGVELRTVALKLFDTSQLLRPAQVLEEARALCRVEHPNVVRFLQLVFDEGVLAIAMEHVAGRSVESRIDEAGVLPLAATLEIGAAVATALACVHSAGIVHRDVKPANVIDANGTYKLIDFGVAARAPAATSVRPPATTSSPPSAAIRVGRQRTADIDVVSGDTIDNSRGTDAATSSDRGDTIDDERNHEPAGTMGYIDPVCLGRRQPADATSDLYALGAMLYECLTGRLPASQGPGEPLSRLYLPVALGVEPPAPLREHAPDVPEEVAKLVDSLIAPARESRPKRAEWVASELERLRRMQGKEARNLPPEGPFRGLAAFDAEHRDVYFGRAAELATAIDMLRTRGVIALVGPSGAGKSSLARAAVVPSVLEGALGEWPSTWESCSFSPGRDPKSALRRALAPLFAGEAMPDTPEEIGDAVAATVDATGRGAIVLIDALEEAVTLATPGGLDDLARFVASAASTRPGFRVVVTVRRDFLDPLLAANHWATALTRGMVLVPPLSAAVLAGVLDDRLAAYGYTLENDELRAELVKQLEGSAESMPLVEFALARLWNERDEKRRMIPKEALARVGGIGGALQQHADQVLAGLSQDIARDILLGMTTSKGTRARRSRADVLRPIRDARGDTVLDALEKARLVVADDGLYTLAHEALLVQWPRLRAWIAATARARATAEEVEEGAARWRERGGTDVLLRGALLLSARDVAANPSIGLSDDARAFVDSSRKWELRNRAGVAALVVSLAVGGLVLFGFYSRAERETLKEKNDARAIAKAMVESKKLQSAEGERAVAKLIQDKTACEKERDKLRGVCGDAGITP